MYLFLTYGSVFIDANKVEDFLAIFLCFLQSLLPSRMGGWVDGGFVFVFHVRSSPLMSRDA